MPNHLLDAFLLSSFLAGGCELLPGGNLHKITKISAFFLHSMFYSDGGGFVWIDYIVAYYVLHIKSIKIMIPS